MVSEKNELIVRKSNELVQNFKFSLSKTEIQIVNYIIANIKSPKYDKEFNVLKFHISEFCHMLGYGTGGADYKKVKDAIRGLAQKKSDWIDVGEYQTIVSWIEKPKFYEKSDIVELKLDDDLKPYLLQLNGYMAANLKYYFEMNSKYSMRLYELLKSYAGFKTIKIETEELRANIDAMGSVYKNSARLRKVLDKAILEINKFTDLLISYNVIKEGRKVAYIEFSITKKRLISEPKQKETGNSRIEFFREPFETINSKWKITDQQIEHIVKIIRESLPYEEISLMNEPERELLIYEKLSNILSFAKANEVDKIFNWLEKMFRVTDLLTRY